MYDKVKISDFANILTFHCTFLSTNLAYNSQKKKNEELKLFLKKIKYLKHGTWQIAE